LNEGLIRCHRQDVWVTVGLGMKPPETFSNTSGDQGQEMSRTSLAQILLHISPPPLNINETRDVYRALKEYGEVEVFKVVRVT